MLADPRSLARWWPRVERVKAVTGEGWTTVLRSERGRALRADWRLEADEAGAATGVGAGARRDAVREGAGRAARRGAGRAGGGGDAGDAGAAPARPRDGAVRALHAAPRGEQGARRRARRADEGGLVRREQVFWGWGEPGAGPSLPEHAMRLPPRRARHLRRRRRPPGGARRRCGCASRRSRPTCSVGSRRSPGDVRDDREARVLRCRGKSYLDLLAQRAGDCERRARRRRGARRPRPGAGRAAGVQRGGRGGRAVRRRHERGRRPRAAARPVRGADLARPRADGRGWSPSTSARSRRPSRPASRLPEADRALAAHGLTLAHLPQSYEWATVGGCVATRSAGQASTGHGRIDENLVAVRVATPLGELATRDAPASAAGPGAAPARRRQRRRARRDHRRDAARAPGARGAALRGLAGAPASRPAATPCGSSSRPASRPTSRGCRTGTRRATRSRSPGPARSCGGASATAA